MQERRGVSVPRRMRGQVGLTLSPCGNAAVPTQQPQRSSPMSLTYVIPDIHGRYDLLSDALASIVARSPSEAGVIVTIGDYVDKGPGSKAVIDRLLAGVAPGWRLVTLKGNHDVMMVEALRDGAKMGSWI